MKDPRTAVGPDIIDRITALEMRLGILEQSASSPVWGTDETIKASHDRLDAILGAGGDGSYLELSEIVAPDAPTTNTLRVYARDDGAGTTGLYYKRSDGTEAELGGGSSGGGPEIWLWPQLAIWTQGSSAKGQLGPGISKSYYCTFPNGVATALSWTFVVPTALAGVDVTVSAYYALSSATNNIRLESIYNVRTAGDNMGLGTEISEIVTVAAADGLQIYTFPTAITLSGAGDVYRLALRRRGADSADNNTGNLALFGLLLKKAQEIT